MEESFKLDSGEQPKRKHEPSPPGGSQSPTLLKRSRTASQAAAAAPVGVTPPPKDTESGGTPKSVTSSVRGRVGSEDHDTQPIRKDHPLTPDKRRSRDEQLMPSPRQPPLKTPNLSIPTAIRQIHPQNIRAPAHGIKRIYRTGSLPPQLSPKMPNTASEASPSLRLENKPLPHSPRTKHLASGHEHSPRSPAVAKLLMKGAGPVPMGGSGGGLQRAATIAGTAHDGVIGPIAIMANRPQNMASIEELAAEVSVEKLVPLVASSPDQAKAMSLKEGFGKRREVRSRSVEEEAEHTTRMGEAVQQWRERTASFSESESSVSGDDSSRASSHTHSTHSASASASRRHVLGTAAGSMSRYGSGGVPMPVVRQHSSGSVASTNTHLEPPSRLVQNHAHQHHQTQMRSRSGSHGSSHSMHSHLTTPPVPSPIVSSMSSPSSASIAAAPASAPSEEGVPTQAKAQSHAENPESTHAVSGMGMGGVSASGMVVSDECRAAGGASGMDG